MKKKILSLVIAFVMLMVIVPSAMAEENSISVIILLISRTMLQPGPYRRLIHMSALPVPATCSLFTSNLSPRNARHAMKAV